MFYEGGYMMGSVHALWWLLWLVVLIGLVAFYVWGPLGMRRRASRDTPLDVLKRRLASGELSSEEHEKRKAPLDGNSEGDSAKR